MDVNLPPSPSLATHTLVVTRHPLIEASCVLCIMRIMLYPLISPGILQWILNLNKIDDGRAMILILHKIDDGFCVTS